MDIIHYKSHSSLKRPNCGGPAGLLKSPFLWENYIVLYDSTLPFSLILLQSCWGGQTSMELREERIWIPDISSCLFSLASTAANEQCFTLLHCALVLYLSSCTQSHKSKTRFVLPLVLCRQTANKFCLPQQVYVLRCNKTQQMWGQ